MAEYYREHGTVPVGQEDKSYPFKSFFDNNVNVSIHSDYPALSGSPDDPFGIMEIAVTGVLWSENGPAWWPEELVTREQALTAMTIGCARQMFIEDVRGSVREGKYADFVGDPDNVTLFGESVGGDSATVLPLIEGSHKYLLGEVLFPN